MRLLLPLLTSALVSCQAPAVSPIESADAPPAVARPVHQPQRPATAIDDRLDKARRLIERADEVAKKREDRK